MTGGAALRALAEYRGHFAAVAAAVAVLALVAAVGPLFLSSIGSAALDLEYSRYGDDAPVVTLMSKTSAAQNA